MRLLDHFLERLPGVLGMRDGHGFSLGHTASLPTCDARRRREKRAVDGGAGVADREVTCRKDAADAYGWADTTTFAVLTGSATWNPASMASGTGATTNVTVTGAAKSDVCACGFDGVTADTWEPTCQVTAANTATFLLTNRTGGAVDLPSGTVRCLVFEG